jgi:hypothetical protein
VFGKNAGAVAPRAESLRPDDPSTAGELTARTPKERDPRELFSRICSAVRASLVIRRHLGRNYSVA